MFEKEAEKYADKQIGCGDGYYEWTDVEQAFKQGAEFGYNKAIEDHEGKYKTAYIKGVRTMANALKDYDRTDGAWTDYFEHTVDKVLNKLLKESE